MASAAAVPVSDFVNVQLTKAGAEHAAGGTLTVSNGRRAFSFTAGTPVRVEKSYEWRAFLSQQYLHSGDAMFELVPDAPASSATTKPAAAVDGATAVAATSGATQATPAPATAAAAKA